MGNVTERAPEHRQHRLSEVARRGAQSADHWLIPVLGGSQRVRVVLVLAAVLALSSADSATVGAAAMELRRSLHIDNTDIGLLVAVTSVVGAVFSLPFGALADRARRTWLLSASILVWSVAMVWSATVGSFGELLGSRVALGAVSAVAGPVVASLVGDWFPSSERGLIYSYVLTGELVGAGLGFAVTGEISVVSWRAAFGLLAVLALPVAWFVARLPEPVRGGRQFLLPDPGTRPYKAAISHPPESEPAPGVAPLTDAQLLAARQGARPIPAMVARADPGMGFVDAVKYVLAVKTNVALIISGACGYYFMAGVETFGVEFVSGQYHVSPTLADLLLLVVGVGSVAGVLAAGPLGDGLLRRGRLSGRPMVAAGAASLAVVFLIPALMTHSALGALPYLIVAAAGLSGQNAPIDSARLDIVPSWLWGRAEGVRTFVRTAAQAFAPVVFGAFSDYVFGGGTRGLYWTFVVMLVPLAASAVYLFFAAHSYPVDVATSAAAQQKTKPAD
jgi:MFS family permease